MELGEADVRIAELLPFWVNGSLPPHEAAEVAAAVAANPAYAAEVDFLRALHRRMQAEAAGYSPGEIGLARLKRSIAAHPGPAPLRRMISLRVAAVAAFVAAGLGFAVHNSFRPAPVEYIQASGGEDGAALVVAFRPDATAKAISQYLLAEGVIILDGPSALGLYRLALLDGNTTSLAALAERLQARTDLFEMVVPAE